jgi:hypothetical protein
MIVCSCNVFDAALNRGVARFAADRRLRLTAT